MTDRGSTVWRGLKCLAASAAAAALLLASPAVAGATSGSAGTTGPPTGTNQQSLQTQAQELAGQIEADGQTLDQLSEAYDAAEMRSQLLDAQLKALRKQMTRTDSSMTQARKALEQQAILSYIAGGGPILAVQSGQAGSDPSLTLAYAEIIAGGQQRAVATYQSLLVAQVRQSKALYTATAQATLAVATLKSDRSAAGQAMGAHQQALDQVKGQEATLVAQVEQSQQAAEEAAVKQSLSQQDQTPPPVTPVYKPSPTTSAPHQDPATTAVIQTTTTDPPVATTVASSPPTTAATTTTVPVGPPPGGNNPAPGWQKAVAYAYAQLGKPYQWGGSGPKAFDCSGLTMMSWAAAGVSFPHLAQAQYNMTERIPLSDALPGDLIFYGTPSNVYHVGIYIGGGEMIAAPETGQVVSISSIYWTGLLGAGRVVE
jgi:cell wall-associated NlpC family hydrolase